VGKVEGASALGAIGSLPVAVAVTLIKSRAVPVSGTRVGALGSGVADDGKKKRTL
jgi:hypothetical protein